MKTQTENQKLCEYNFECEDYAKDGSWKSWSYRVENNAPAKHHIHFFSKESGDDFEYDVCDGCLAMLTPVDDDDDIEILSEKRIAPSTESHDGKRGKKNHSVVHKALTQSDVDEILKRLKK